MAKPEGVELSFDADATSKRGRQVIDRIVDAGARAVATNTKALERRLEDATRGAVPGRLWRAWASRFFENSGPDAAGSVYVKGGRRSRGAIAFWTRPGTIRGTRDQYLAIPLPAAGPRGRGRDLTPGEWEARTGIRLRFVYRPGRASLLVADEAVLSGRNRIARRNTDRRIAAGRGSATVPIFVLIAAVKFRNAVAIPPLVAAAERQLVADFIANSR